MQLYGEKTLKRIHKAFEIGNIKDLEEKDVEIVERISFADDQIRKIGPSRAAKMVKTKFGLKSERHAYFIIDAAQQLFGTKMMAHKEYWRQFAIDKIVTAMIHIGNAIEEKQDRNEDGSLKFDDEGNPIMKASEVSTWELGSLARLAKELRETVGYSNEDHDAQFWEGAKQKIITFTGDVRTIGIEPVSPQERNRLLDKFLGTNEDDEESRDD